MSHYDVLGARPDADADELRAHFVRMARRYHPDRHVGAEPSVQRDAERRMRQITEAWAVLGDPHRRRRYDQGLGDRVPGRHDRAGTTTSATPPPGTGFSAGRTTRPGAAGGSGSGSGANPSWRDPVLRPGARVATEERSWRHYASPGDGGNTRRSLPRLALVMSPTILLGVAGVFAVAGAMVRWSGFWAAALAFALAAGAAFFMLPIWAMTKGNAHRRRPARHTRRSY